MYPAAPKGGVALKDIAQRVLGEVRGNPDLILMGLCSLTEPQPRSLAFISNSRKRSLASALSASTVDALLMPLEAHDIDLTGKNVVLVKDPLAAMVELIPLFFRPIAHTEGVHPSAVVDSTATIDPSAEIGALCVIGPAVVIGKGARLMPHVVVYEGAVIGEGALLHSGVTVRERCEVGAGCVIQNGAIIGSDGFGYFFKPGTGLVPVPQVGTARLAARVDVGANACIDRGTFGTTSINYGAKIDNLVQIGHNVSVGQHSIVCGQAGIAGSCKIGNGVTIGGAAGISDHLTLADGVRVGGGTVVLEDLPTKGDFVGYPATPVIQWKRQQVALTRLPKLLREAASKIKGRN